MRARPAVALASLVAALALGGAGCGSGDSGTTTTTDADGGGTRTLTIYSSLPLQGAARAQSLSIVNAEKLALAQAGGRVGPFTVKYRSLDDASEGKWNPAQVANNARQAAQDQSTIVYLGDRDSGASAISIPVLNEAGILQISPASTAVGLTRSEGGDKGEPDKYYPSGKRTFGRVVPADQIQAAAQLQYQQDHGCSRLYVLDDKDVYGVRLARQVEQAATKSDVMVVGTQSIDPRAGDYRSLADDVVADSPDCVFFGGTTQDNAVQLWRDLHAADRQLKLFGGDGVAETAFTSKLSPSEQRVTYLTAPTLAPDLYPAAGQRFFREYRREFGQRPEPYAIFGYEAMRLALDLIKSAPADGDQRQAVVDAFFRVKDRNSVLGRYSIDENGDTTLTDYGAWRIRHGRLAFDQVLHQRG
ncbi:MAG TPA: branched-chain amino acid ABC transporter substrate-binding protein [Baekduia sp.]|nr:branched-chain amino acid ABC transporter substrate-binding protein [Baekduia sp.]